ncbi:MAG: hypothetical protein L0227_04350, partial [Chloroflexi bacterium]|nr:hypothetical protein [Chloroflexota bacterium]
MADEHDPPAACPAEPAEHDREPVAGHLLAGPIGIGPSGRGIGLEALHATADLSEQRHHPVL